MKRCPLLAPNILKPVLELCIGISLFALAVITPLFLLFIAYRRRQQRIAAGESPSIMSALLVGAIATSTAAVLVDALLIEPNFLTVTRARFPMRSLPVGRTLRIVHLSDLHITVPRRLFRRLISQVALESPDLILITGDLVQEPPRPGQWECAADLFRQLADIAPLVMIPGGHDKYPVPNEPTWRLLRNEAYALEIRGIPLQIIGWDDRDGDPEWRPPAHGALPGRVNIVLTHSPDWFDLAADLGADLALAGHTHGGQVRLPLWGAVVTTAYQGKRFEYGPYCLGDMWAFVTRGIAHSPWPTPPIRVLCPPEMVVLTLIHGE